MQSDNETNIDLYEDDLSETEHVSPPDWMSAAEYLELCAIEATCGTINRPTFLMKCHWPTHRRLARNGFITWAPRPGVMADVDITDKGRKLVFDTFPSKSKEPYPGQHNAE